MNISLEEIEDAYRKLKSYIYYDNSALYLRRDISKFERSPNFKEALTKIEQVLNNTESEDSEKYLSNLLSNISFYIVPKKFELNEFEKDEYIISNKYYSDSYKLKSATYVIKADIELHIIAVLWILKVGYLLENNIVSNSFAYKLNIDYYTGKIKENQQIYKPYYKQYQQWRDNGIEVAKRILFEKNNVALISIDFKDFFHSVELDFSELNKYLSTFQDYHEYKPLTDILSKIYITYTGIFKKVKSFKSLLPIGIMSSGLIANWYLRKFDLSVNEVLKPSYYGRYVDDILIVITNPEIEYNLQNETYKGNQEKRTITQVFLKRYFCDGKNGLLSKDRYESYNVKGYTGLKIQKDKVKLYLFDAEESKAVLDQFVKNIRNNSSEFRFLPEEENIKKEFIDEAYSIIYNDSVNKLRSIEECKFDKYGASKYLAKQIFSSRLWDNENNSKKVIAEQILAFFRGRLCLEFYSLWEKIATYFVISGLKDEFIEFCLEVIKCINKIEVNNEFGKNNNLTTEKIEEKLKKNLLEYFRISIAMPISLNINFYDDKIKKAIAKSKFNIMTAIRIRRSNMFRHNYVFFPLFNYTRLLFSNDINLLERNLDKYKINNKNEAYSLGISEGSKLVKYSPRFIHIHETSLYIINNRILTGNINKGKEYCYEKDGFYNKYFDDAYELFYRLNYGFGVNTPQNNIKKSMIRDMYPLIITEFDNDNNDISYNKVYVGCRKRNDDDYPNGYLFESEYKNKLKIAIANMKVFDENIKVNCKHKPNLSNERAQQLFKLLNMIENEKSDIFIMPECSIPHAWLSIVAKFCNDQQKALVCGLEHYISPSSIAYNFIATILPFEVNDHKCTLIKIRLKNHYAPEEKIILKGYHIPKPVPYSYDLFIWKGIYFACFYCYELADIRHRSLFRSKVDLLIASEFNTDVTYFSNILESTCRDVHCYFAQVNSSDYGDSRLIQPAETKKRNIIQLKGGENITILTETIDIEGLRNFQIKSQSDQKEDMSFKQTPPDFDINDVIRRIRGTL